MKKRDIEKTMKKRKFFTEKRRLESQELQFFMLASDNRMLRVKHGAKLDEVLSDQQMVNTQPLGLIETAIPKQQTYTDLFDQKFGNTGNNESDANIKQSNNFKGLLLSDYVKDNRFNPAREIQKERNIQDFFYQKKLMLNDYLEDEQDNDNPQPIRSDIVTSIMKSKRKKRRNIKKTQSVVDLNQKQKGFQYTLKKSRADEFIEQIERQVTAQVDREFKRKHDIEQEQRIMQQEIQQKTQQSQKRIQLFVDPRSSKIRTNFRVLNEQLGEIRKIDPQLKVLQRVQSNQRLRTADPSSNMMRSNSSAAGLNRVQFGEWRMKSNAEILNEILQIGRY